MVDKKNNIQWREDMGHLPVFMRDFHAQKDLFKALSSSFENAEECPLNFRDGQIYTIDWFLWFMAIHGYKLTKTTANIEHKDIDDAIAQGWDYRL
tara:strand:+ start:859 stop:1143 length:285 start_codon:yes stop_codon:yes gene_type:complete